MKVPSMSQTLPLSAARLDAASVIEALVATSLAPIEPGPARHAALGARIFQRVAHSAQASASFINVRKGDGAWRESAPGVGCKLLHPAEGVVSQLVRLEPGANWSVEDADATDELLILSGDLKLDDLRLGPHDYHLRGAQTPALRAHSAGGCLLYWRRSVGGQTAFGAVRASVTVAANETGWEPLRPGVMLKPLFGVGERVSMLARLAAGAGVPTHVHACAEECVMLEGDMFLGDVLLLEGEYQWAPAGTNHDMLYSDVGCVVFIHGAVDPALKQGV